MKRIILIAAVAAVSSLFSSPAQAVVVPPGDSIRASDCYTPAKNVHVYTARSYGTRELKLDSYWPGVGWVEYWHLGKQWRATVTSMEDYGEGGEATYVHNTGRRAILVRGISCT